MTPHEELLLPHDWKDEILRFKPKGFVTLDPLFYCTHFRRA